MRPFSSYLAACATAAVLACSLQSASAADLPRRPAAAAPVPYVAPMYNWTGFYAGVNLGWGWSDGDGTIDVDGVGSGPIAGDGDGIFGGVQLGYNWQNGAFVFGVETDIQVSGGSGDVTGSPGAATLTADADNPWFGTIRARLGYAHDRWLWYVTGGGAYGKAELDGTISGPSGGAFSSSETYWAWTVGAGVEWAMWDRWSAKLEYLYIGDPSDVPTPPDSTIDGSIDTHLIRAGLNYRF
jgi:outer membrane immunogenic protein